MEQAGVVESACWRKSSLSAGNGECVEVAELPDGEIAVRNSNRAAAGMVRFTKREVAAWIQGCKAGEFDDLLR